MGVFSIAPFAEVLEGGGLLGSVFVGCRGSWELQVPRPSLFATLGHGDHSKGSQFPPRIFRITELCGN